MYDRMPITRRQVSMATEYLVAGGCPARDGDTRSRAWRAKMLLVRSLLATAAALSRPTKNLCALTSFVR
jgi:hypothetical protein